jgi:hypothetical protein
VSWRGRESTCGWCKSRWLTRLSLSVRLPGMRRPYDLACAFHQSTLAAFLLAKSGGDWFCPPL